MLNQVSAEGISGSSHQGVRKAIPLLAESGHVSATVEADSTIYREGTSAWLTSSFTSSMSVVRSCTSLSSSAILRQSLESICRGGHVKTLCIAACMLQYF